MSSIGDIFGFAIRLLEMFDTTKDDINLYVNSSLIHSALGQIKMKTGVESAFIILDTIAFLNIYLIILEIF